MAKPCLIETIKQSMTERDGKHFEVFSYCEVAQIKRNEFYSRYKHKKHFFFIVLSLQLERHFNFHQGNDFKQIINAIIDDLIENYEVYLWMYESSSRSEHNYIRTELSAVWFDYLREYAFEHEGISRTRLLGVAIGMYSQLFDWVIHECREDKAMVYRALQPYLFQLNGHKCENDFNNK